jgi:hypothetical protein
VTPPPPYWLLSTSLFTNRTDTLAPPASATVFTSGEKAPVVIVEAPTPIVMSLAVGGGGWFVELMGLEPQLAAPNANRMAGVARRAK